MKKVEIVPSLLSSDFADLAGEIKKIERSGCRRIQLDVMDGSFVPNITFGPVLIRSIRKRTDLIFEAQLMLERPDLYIEAFMQAGIDSVLIHRESPCDYLDTIRKAKSLGMEAGVALNPKTPVQSVEDILGEVDQVLVMTVEPGFGGQQFIKEMENKISEMRDLLKKKGIDIPIEVDGGINTETAPTVVKAGASRLVAGHAIFSGDLVDNIGKLLNAASTV